MIAKEVARGGAHEANSVFEEPYQSIAQVERCLDPFGEVPTARGQLAELPGEPRRFIDEGAVEGAERREPRAVAPREVDVRVQTQGEAVCGARCGAERSEGRARDTGTARQLIDRHPQLAADLPRTRDGRHSPRRLVHRVHLGAPNRVEETADLCRRRRGDQRLREAGDGDAPARVTLREPPNLDQPPRVVPLGEDGRQPVPRCVRRGGERPRGGGPIELDGLAGHGMHPFRRRTPIFASLRCRHGEAFGCGVRDASLGEANRRGGGADRGAHQLDLDAGLGICRTGSWRSPSKIVSTGDSRKSSTFFL